MTYGMLSFFLGRRNYVEVLRLQEVIFQSKIDRQLALRRGTTRQPLITDVTLLVEHSDPVYTLGRRDTSEGLPSDPAGQSVAVVRTRRGGGITYHGPGQLTVYPIANIQSLWRACSMEGKQRSPIEWFSTALERTMIGTVAEYGIPSHGFKTGVWSDPCGVTPARKLGSIGLQLGSWVSMHGAGLNVTTDLRFFDHIVMCELPGKSATSIAEELRLRGLPEAVPTVEEVAVHFLRHLDAALRSGNTGNDGPYRLESVANREDWREYILKQACIDGHPR